MKSFNELSLPEKLQSSLKVMKFETPTPIQAAAIPVALKGLDLIGRAQTGTGKTAAFVIPTIAKIMANPKSIALILTPTRELAAQIQEVVNQITQHSQEIRSALLIGGASMGPQIRALRAKPSVIIATPGRVTDHLKRNHLDLSTAETVVLDEADRMLDMGFAPQIEKVFEFISKKRQTLLFSATLPENILKLAQKYMSSPEKVSVGSVDQPVANIKQTHISVDGKEKNNKIVEVLKSKTGSILVFARTKLRTDRLARHLKAEGFKVASIHGGRTQSQRQQALEGFRDGYYPILVATDVAARGLDIPQIELVINFDLPETREDYTHRIGRTARAGAKGEAMSFVTQDEMRYFMSLSKPVQGKHVDNPRQHKGSGHSNKWRQRSRGFQGKGRGSRDGDSRGGRSSFGGGSRGGDSRGRSSFSGGSSYGSQESNGRSQSGFQHRSSKPAGARRDSRSGGQSFGGERRPQFGGDRRPSFGFGSRRAKSR